MIYTVTFNPAIDYVVHTDAMQVGMVNRSHGEKIYYGGKGINVSVILKELGIPSRALGFVAGFTGAAIEKGVQEMGIATDFVHLESGFSRINVKIKSGDDLQDGDTIILAGSIPNTMPSDIYEKILAYLDGRQIRTVVDATNDLLKNVLKYKPFLIKPNNFELGELFGVTLHSREEIAAYAGKLQEMGARNVLVSMAEDGALLLEENGNCHNCGVCSGTVKNSVGAGDSMLAGFLAGLEQGDAAYALKLGTAAGGATTFSEGLAKREEIDRLLQQLGVV